MRRAILIALTAVLFTTGLAAAEQHAAPQIDCAFPGGNILLERVEGDTVTLKQDLRDTAGHWFYWYFRVRGAAGRTLTFRFTGGDVFTRMGPSCSLDGGQTWRWVGPESLKAPPPAPSPSDPRLTPGAGQGEPRSPADPRLTPGAGQGALPAKPAGPTFTYAFGAEAGEVRFALSIPYTEANLKEFLAQHQGRAGLKVDTLCRTGKGRQAEVLYLGRLDGPPDYRLAFTCRHHACESVASYVLEGIMASVLADDDLGRWYRQHAAILAVPFVDKDGVEDGDQGKNRKPHDHNRDYADGDTLHPTVAAIKTLLPAWSAGRLDAAIDLHCPSLKDDYIHFVGGPEPEFWERALRLCALLKEVQNGPLVYAPADNVPFGTKWNTGSGTQMSFGRWARTVPGARLVTTIEFPYALAHKTPVTADGARAFGRDVAVALRQWLEADAGALPRPTSSQSP
jgi:hypothetical protein